MDTQARAARQPIGYLPENHRFPTYMTGRGMLDFYGALSGMDDADAQAPHSGTAGAGGTEAVGRLRGWANIRKACCNAWAWRRR